MMSIHPASIAALMLLLHFIADYTLQGCLADLKQRKWWRDKIKSDEVWDKYKDDYKIALLSHGMYWSLIVCLPLLMAGGWVYSVNAAVHGLVHTGIDDMKANRLSINLKEDQLLHVVQLVLIWTAWLIYA